MEMFSRHSLVNLLARSLRTACRHVTVGLEIPGALSSVLVQVS